MSRTDLVCAFDAAATSENSREVMKCRFSHGPKVAGRGTDRSKGSVSRIFSILFLLFVMGSLAGSIAAQAPPPGTPPAPPSPGGPGGGMGLVLTSNVVGNSVMFQWADTTGSTAVAYQLHAGSAPGSSNIAIVQLPPSPQSFAASGPPGIYYVRLVGIYASAASAASNELAVTIEGGGCTPPGPPTGLIAISGIGNVTVNWNAPTVGSAPTGYRIEAGTAPGASNVGAFLLPPITSVSSPIPSGQYYVRVTAINACGTSPASSETSFAVGSVGGASLAGNWSGVVFNYTRPFGRGVLTNFDLRIDTPPPATGVASRAGLWIDNLGCRHSLIATLTSMGLPIISMESLACTDGDFTLRVRSNTGTVVEGTCNGGPNCTFRMTRR